MTNKKGKTTYDFFQGKSNKNLNLVFVHGTGCNRSFLRMLSDELSEYNRYLIDLPGHGDSEDTGYTAENYIDAVSDFISDIKNVVLIGHSLGGTIVIGTGERHIETIKGLVILNSGASFPKIDTEFSEKLRDKILDFERLAFLIGHTDNPDVQKAASCLKSKEVILNDCFVSLNINYEKDLDKINVPVCIIGGEKDLFVYPEYSQHLHEKIKNSTLYILPNAVHALPIDMKKEAAKLILDFTEKI